MAWQVDGVSLWFKVLNRNKLPLRSTCPQHAVPSCARLGGRSDSWWRASDRARSSVGDWTRTGSLPTGLFGLLGLDDTELTELVSEGII